MAEHVAFYQTATQAALLMFVVLVIQSKVYRPPAPPWWLRVLLLCGFAMFAAPFVIGISVLGGFISDTPLTRGWCWGATVGDVVVATGLIVSGLYSN